MSGIGMFPAEMSFTTSSSGAVPAIVPPSSGGWNAPEIAGGTRTRNGWACVVRFGGVGDNLIAASVLPGLKKKFGKVEVITGLPQSCVFEHNPYIDKLSVPDKQFIPQDSSSNWQKWFLGRSLEYDAFYHLSHSCETIRALFVGQTQFWWPAEWRRKFCHQNYLETVCDICEVPYEFKPLFYASDAEKEHAIDTKKKVGERCIAWIISGTRIDKTHPYAPMIIARLIKEVGPVVMLGGPKPSKDFDQAKMIQEMVIRYNGDDKGLHLGLSHDPERPNWPIRRVLTMAQHCDLVVTPDTGPAWACAFEPNKKIMLLSHASAENITKWWKKTVTLHADPVRVPCAPCHQLHDSGDTCHDAETDALTDMGWKRFSDLDGSERLATVDPKTTKLTFEVPTRLIRYHYSGPMVSGKSQVVDFCVTPDHKMLTAKMMRIGSRNRPGKFRLREIRYIDPYCRLLDRVQYDGEVRSDTYLLPAVDNPSRQTRADQKRPRPVLMKAWLRLVGLYVAEGTLLKFETNKHYRIQLAASKERERTFIRNVLSDLQLAALELPDRFVITNQQVYKALESYGLLGVKALSKFVPRFVFRQSAEMIRAFLEGHFAGDGCIHTAVTKHTPTHLHYTSSQQLADDLHALVFLSGMESRLRIRKPADSVVIINRANGPGVIASDNPGYTVTVCSGSSASHIDRKRDLAVTDYDGEVFCAEMPKFHTLVTRRGGRVLVSGNCTPNRAKDGAACISDLSTDCILMAAKALFSGGSFDDLLAKYRTNVSLSADLRSAPERVAAE